MRFAVPALWLIAVHLVLATACMAPAVHASGMDHAHMHHDTTDMADMDGECPHGHCTALDESAPGGNPHEEWPAAALPSEQHAGGGKVAYVRAPDISCTLPIDVGRLRSVVLLC